MEHGMRTELIGEMWWNDESTKKHITEFHHYGENFSFTVEAPAGGIYQGRCTMRDGGEYEGAIFLKHKGQSIRGRASCHIVEMDGDYRLSGSFTIDEGANQMWFAHLHKKEHRRT
jgi:hypothetical protein